jgi:mannose/fructose/N-acetylgalactosamine-specific phosphotransferase system component IID
VFLTTESKVQEMWRHITGVEQPAKKIELDNNEKLERKRTYDQVKRKRKFQTSWQKKRMITKNYIHCVIIILLEIDKIIMKKECQYCHHLKHHHHQRHHHPVWHRMVFGLVSVFLKQEN